MNSGLRNKLTLDISKPNLSSIGGPGTTQTCPQGLSWDYVFFVTGYDYQAEGIAKKTGKYRCMEGQALRKCLVNIFSEEPA